MSHNLLNISLTRDGLISRRCLLQSATAGLAAVPFLQRLGLSADTLKREGRACIVVWLNGAPSQLETWDPKPGAENGGPTQVIDTAIPGVQFAEYWPNLAALMTDVSVVRSIVGKEAAHERGAYHLLTGRRLGGTSHFPHFGSVVARELGDPDSDLPSFVCIGNTLSSGFLGVKYAPFEVPAAGQLPANVAPRIETARADRRLSLLREQDQDFADAGAQAIAFEHQEIYAKAARLMTSERLKAFTLDGESDAVKQTYGAHQFGQGCLVARRLVESGVPFVQVQRSGWDMHANLWQNIPNAAGEVDQGVAALVTDLKDRGLLDRTLIVVLGEFGRTPKINQSTPGVGRDHWARNFNVLLAGGGLKGGVCVGATSPDGMEVTNRPVEVDDLFQTLCHSLGIDADEELITPEGRPLRIVDAGQPIPELVG